MWQDLEGQVGDPENFTRGLFSLWNSKYKKSTSGMVRITINSIEKKNIFLFFKQWFDLGNKIAFNGGKHIENLLSWSISYIYMDEQNT